MAVQQATNYVSRCFRQSRKTCYLPSAYFNFSQRSLMISVSEDSRQKCCFQTLISKFLQVFDATCPIFSIYLLKWSLISYIYVRKQPRKSVTYRLSPLQYYFIFYALSRVLISPFGVVSLQLVVIFSYPLLLSKLIFLFLKVFLITSVPSKAVIPVFSFLRLLLTIYGDLTINFSSHLVSLDILWFSKFSREARSFLWICPRSFLIWATKAGLIGLCSITWAFSSSRQSLREMEER